MHDVAIPPELVQDPWEKNVPGLGLGRDPERTPMLWDSSLNAGFSAATPWLPVAPGYQTTNVRAQRDDPTSMLTLYRRLMRATPCHTGPGRGHVHCGGGTRGGTGLHADHLLEKRFLVVLNLGTQPRNFRLR